MNYSDYLAGMRDQGQKDGLRFVELLRQTYRTPEENEEMFGYLGSMYWCNENIERDKYEWAGGFKYGVYRAGFKGPKKYDGVFKNSRYNNDFLEEFTPREPGFRTHREMVEAALAEGATYVSYGGYFYGAFWKTTETGRLVSLCHFNYDPDMGWWEKNDQYIFNWNGPKEPTKDMVRIKEAADTWDQWTQGKYK
jgi:hypothetical protein